MQPRQGLRQVGRGYTRWLAPSSDLLIRWLWVRVPRGPPWPAETLAPAHLRSRESWFTPGVAAGPQGSRWLADERVTGRPDRRVALRKAPVVPFGAALDLDHQVVDPRWAPGLVRRRAAGGARRGSPVCRRAGTRARTAPRDARDEVRCRRHLVPRAWCARRAPAARRCRPPRCRARPKSFSAMVAAVASGGRISDASPLTTSIAVCSGPSTSASCRAASISAVPPWNGSSAVMGKLSCAPGTDQAPGGRLNVVNVARCAPRNARDAPPCSTGNRSTPHQRDLRRKPSASHSRR